VSDWRWECHPDDLLDNLPPEVRKQLDQLAREITVRDSMVYLGGVVDAVGRAALGGIAPPASRSEEISSMSDDSAPWRQSHP
jgi:hypothetical protein